MSSGEYVVVEREVLEEARTALHQAILHMDGEKRDSRNITTSAAAVQSLDNALAAASPSRKDGQ